MQTWKLEFKNVKWLINNRKAREKIANKKCKITYYDGYQQWPEIIRSQIILLWKYLVWVNQKYLGNDTE